MADDSDKIVNIEDPEQGVLDHEASIWEVLRKSEEKIRQEKRRLNQEKAEVARMREKLFAEKDELVKLKDEVILEKKQTIKERDELSGARDHLAVQRQKATRLIGRLEEQQLNLRDRVDDVNLKITEVEKRTKALLVRERALLITSDDIKAKSKELIKWENEIIDKEKDSAKKAKTLIDTENALREKEKAINEKEKSINRVDQERLSRETELNDRWSQLLAKEKLQQEDYEKLLAAKAQLLERETHILSREKVLENGGTLEPIEPASADLKGLDIDEVEKDLGLQEETGSYPEIAEEEPQVESTPPPESNQENHAVEIKPEQQPESEEVEEATKGERVCPRCGTMISKVATTCFACGTDLVPEEVPSVLQVSTDKEGREKEAPAESEFLDFENKESGGKVQVPTREELYTMNEEQLVSVSTDLGLDTSGRVKHLRERLIEYIEKAEREGVPPGKGDRPEVSENNEGEKAPACTECGSELNYIEQYDRYYCYSCEKYAKKS
jgi:predicted RNA-binding Zn-ribbon protein involved in translation (DUF1610 family)